MKKSYYVNLLIAGVLCIVLKIAKSNQEDLSVEPENLKSFNEKTEFLLNDVNQNSNDNNLLNLFDSSIYYKINWKERPNDFVLNEKDENILSIVASDLNYYYCVLPNVELKEQISKEDVNIDPYSKITELLNKKICIYKLDSYWTYEICLNDYIRQFRGNILEKKHAREYILGYYESSNLENDRRTYLEKITNLKDKKKELPKIDYDGIKVPFIYVTMDKGTICDLTNRPRKTTVYFVCDKNDKPQLKSVEEVQSCEYSAIVSTNLLCDHPYFEEKKENEFQINCFPNMNEVQPIKPIGIEQYENKPFNFYSETILNQIQEMVSNSKFESELEALEKANNEIRTFETSKYTRETLNNREMSIMSFLEAKKCYVGTYKSYWNYSFCFKKSIKMFHEEAGHQTKEILLGQFDKDKHLIWLKANEKNRRTSTEVNYLFSNGDICHETNRLRYVEVKLRCPSVNTKNFSMKLEEPKICEYKLTIESSLMCKVLELVDENDFFFKYLKPNLNDTKKLVKTLKLRRKEEDGREMVEIKAKLTRLPVYFANEIVSCLVTFTNNSSNNELERLAWSVVQIHCLLYSDENKINISTSQKDSRVLKEEQVIKNLSNRDTSFHPMKDERGQVIFSTNPKFLFCDLKLNSNESKTFQFNDRLPDHSPPSFNGSAIKYSYKITIGIQRVNSNIQLLRMPIKVFNLPPNEKSTVENQSDCKLYKSHDSNFSYDDNVFNQSDTVDNSQLNTKKHGEIINLILHKLDCLSSKRTLSSYIITNHLGKVGKFCIFKSVFKLGEDVIGFFDFSDSEIPCVQFTVTLQSEEKINEEYKSIKLKNNKTPYTPHLTNYSQCQEFCLHLENTQISLPIPLTITPTFETKIITLKWRLYFEFLTARLDDLDQKMYEDEFGRLELGPKSMNVQTMIWELPITILPTNPSKIGQSLQLPDTSIIIV